MRKSLQERGKWTHPVPQQEEGEPAPKHGRWYESTLAGLDVGGTVEKTPPTPSPAAEPDTPDSLPPLEDSPTDEGTPCRIQGSVYWPGYGMTPQCWMEYRRQPLILYNSSFSETLSVF